MEEWIRTPGWEMMKIEKWASVNFEEKVFNRNG